MTDNTQSFHDFYKSLTQDQWLGIIHKANEMQLETLKEAARLKEQAEIPSEIESKVIVMR